MIIFIGNTLCKFCDRGVICTVIQLTAWNLAYPQNGHERPWPLFDGLDMVELFVMTLTPPPPAPPPPLPPLPPPPPPPLIVSWNLE